MRRQRFHADGCSPGVAADHLQNIHRQAAAAPDSLAAVCASIRAPLVADRTTNYVTSSSCQRCLLHQRRNKQAHLPALSLRPASHAGAAEVLTTSDRPAPSSEHSGGRSVPAPPGDRHRALSARTTASFRRLHPSVCLCVCVPPVSAAHTRSVPTQQPYLA